MSDSPVKPLKVAVIGAGLGGLVLAKTILTEGPGNIEVQVYEAWESWKTRGGSLQMAQGAKILRRLGLGDVLEAKSNAPKEMKFFFDSQVVASSDFDSAKGVRITMRTDLQSMLVDSMPPDTFKLGHKLSEIAENRDGVVLTFENGVTCTADLVVAADGIHSVVKRKIFNDDKPEHTGFRCLYALCSKPIRSDPSMMQINWYEVGDKGYQVVDWTAGSGESRHDGHSFVFRDDELVSERWDSTIVKEKMKDMTKDILSRHPTLAAAIENADICFDWGVYSQPKLPSWISPLGKIVLLGDAAHASAPFMGQGGNMAMEDGWVLGKVLLNVKADGFSLLEALQRYESKRMSHCEGIVSKSTTVGGMNTSTGFKARLRNFMVPFMLKKMQADIWIDPTEEDPCAAPGCFESITAKLGLR
eukprot:CAMPEP_0181464108 /NCGR_PEP_ID=MMETSP1110-20121109/35258_1 /TAXON_ID=174948 /ORGANISM="Symbiodinium sp., Strain CCMP421" /LENGTH=415 /DNA_ID=CAMNT_0023588823 /DNA_START=34 /DNA_END=1281 /DNA_ORIENTATION=-